MRKNAGLKLLIAQPNGEGSGSLGRVVSEVGVARMAVEASTEREALELTTKIRPDVALVDLDLSEDGSLIDGLRDRCPAARIIVLADRDKRSTSDLVTALERGATGALFRDLGTEEGAWPSELTGQEATGVMLGSYLDAMAEKRRRDLAAIESLATAVETRDQDTGRHLQRVTKLATRCMREIDSELAQDEEVEYGFMLHDVGKIGVPDAILCKPGPLGVEEWQHMRRHPELGVKIVEPIGFSSATTDVILSHHEHWDGGGYPLGLAGEEIPVTARAFAVADAYDAMTSNRPYRPAMSHRSALHVIRAESGRLYDPDIVDVFIDLTD